MVEMDGEERGSGGGQRRSSAEKHSEGSLEEYR